MQHGTPIVRSATPFDSGLYRTDVWSLISSCSQICLISPILNSHALSVMTSRILFWDSFSVVTLNILKASGASDLSRNGRVYTARL